MAFSDFLVNLGEVAGLEINQDLIRVILLKRSGQELSVKSAGQIPLPPGVIEDGHLKKPEILASKIKELFRVSRPKKIKTPHVIVALPEELAYIQVISFPSLPPEKMEEAIGINIERAAPFQKGDIYSHYQILNEKKAGRIDVLAAAASSKDIKSYLSALRILKLVPLAFETPAVSLARSVKIGKPSCLVFFYPHEAVVSIVDSNSLKFSYSVRLKNNSSETDVSRAIQKVINYYEAHFPESSKIKNILLAGADAQEMIKKIQLGPEIKSELMPAKVQTKGYQVLPGSESLVALGLALRGLLPLGEDEEVSLLPLGAKDQAEERREKEFFGFLIRFMITTLLGIIIIFAGFCLLLYNLKKQTQSEFQALEATPKIEEVSDLEEEAKNFNSLVSEIYNLKDKKLFWSNIYELVSSVRPPNVVLRGIEISAAENQVKVAGTAATREDILTFSDSLKEKEGVSDLNLPLESLKQKENVNFSFSFKVTSELVGVK